MTVYQMPKYPCPFCHKNEATQLCDFVVNYSWMSVRTSRGCEVGRIHETCNNPMCKECANKIGSSHEFCPDCMKLYEYIKENYKPRHTKLNADIAFGKVK